MSRRLNSCLPTHTSATAHLPGPQNPGMCHLYFAEGCHLYIALTVKSRIIVHYGKRFKVFLKYKSSLLRFGDRAPHSAASRAIGPALSPPLRRASKDSCISRLASTLRAWL